MPWWTTLTVCPICCVHWTVLSHAAELYISIIFVTYKRQPNSLGIYLAGLVLVFPHPAEHYQLHTTCSPKKRVQSQQPCGILVTDQGKQLIHSCFQSSSFTTLALLLSRCTQLLEQTALKTGSRPHPLATCRKIVNRHSCKCAHEKAWWSKKGEDRWQRCNR